MTGSGLPGEAQVVEVGPRDGLQNERSTVPTDVKVELVERLGRCGFREIEVSSFVSPTAVPQLADAADVFARIRRTTGVGYTALVPNMRGYDAARAAGADAVALFTAASETFSERNVRTSIAGTLERFAPVVAAAHDDGVHVRAYVSTAFGCPFEGQVAPAAVHAVVDRLVELRVQDISVGDTIGVAVPHAMQRVLAPLIARSDLGRLALHAHDTRGTALANIWAALELGVTTFDGSVAGLGGCPFAPGATGNVASEDLTWMLERCGVRTGIDFDHLLETSAWISDRLGRSPAGHVAAASRWP